MRMTHSCGATLVSTVVALSFADPGRAFSAPLAAGGQILHMSWVRYRNDPSTCPLPHKEVTQFLNKAFEDSKRPERIESEAIEGYNVDKIVSAAEDGQLDLGYFTPYTLVLVNERLEVGQRFSPIKSYASCGQDERFAVVAWRLGEAAGIEAVLELLQKDRGLKLALVDVRSTSGYLWPKMWLLGKGIDIERGDITTIMASRHDAALDLLRDRDDVIAAATFDEELERYDNPDKPCSHRKRKFSVYTLTPPLPLDVIAVRDDLTEDLKTAIDKAFDAMNIEEKGQDVFKRCFSGKMDRWTKADSSYDNLVRAYLRVTPGVGHDAPGAAADGSAPRAAGAPVRKPPPRTSGRATGYLTEEKDDDLGEMTAFGVHQQVKPGMAAEIYQSIWGANGARPSASQDVMEGRVISVDERGYARVCPARKADRRNLKRQMNPRDRATFTAEAFDATDGTSRGAHLSLEATNASFASNGDMDVEFRIDVINKGGERLPAGKYGWLIETDTGRPNGTRVHLIPPEESQVSDHLVLSGGSAASRVTARLLGEVVEANAAKTFGFWSALVLWWVVFLGALLGFCLRLAAIGMPKKEGENGPSRSASLHYWLKRVVEVCSALGVAAVLFAWVLIVRTKLLPEALDPNAFIVRLGTGLAGGILGASGLGALVNRLLGIKTGM